jgi:hypothetical protein
MTIAIDDATSSIHLPLFFSILSCIMGACSLSSPLSDLTHRKPLLDQKSSSIFCANGLVKSPSRRSRRRVLFSYCLTPLSPHTRRLSRRARTPNARRPHSRFTMLLSRSGKYSLADGFLAHALHSFVHSYQVCSSAVSATVGADTPLEDRSYPPTSAPRHLRFFSRTATSLYVGCIGLVERGRDAIVASRS